MKDSLIVNEIFGSIDGEGIRTGELATFIRLAGCNLRCSYCDTSYALTMKDGTSMTIDEILDKIDEIGYKNITLTGGEPLIHKNVDKLIDKLIEKGYNLNIETNGAVDITPYIAKKLILTMDFKTKSSDMINYMKKENIALLREYDVFKLVCEKSDFDDIEKILRENDIKSYIYLSPIFGKIEPYELVDFLKSLHDKGINTDKIRVQVQLHKIIWEPSKRGV